MVSEAQAEYIRALISERHSAVKRDFNDLLNAIAKVELAEVKGANKKLRDSLEALKAVVAQKHLPNWLIELSANAVRYDVRHTNGIGTWRAHLDSLMNSRELLQNETWNFDDDSSSVIDIDAIISAAQKKFKIEEVYERVIDALKSILNSGEIDSLKAKKDLQEIISSLNFAKNGSFSSQIFTWRFAKAYARNTINIYVKESSSIGPLVRSFEKTAEELDISLASAADEIRRDISDLAAEVFNAEVHITFDGQEPLQITGG